MGELKAGRRTAETPGGDMQSRRLSVCSLSGEPDFRDGFRNWIKTQGGGQSRRGSVSSHVGQVGNSNAFRDSRASSRRSSIVSTQGDDLDLGWLAWRDSRRSESRRTSVVSISGEDHGLRSVSNWTRALNAAKKEKENRNNLHVKTGRTFGTTQAPSDKLR